MSDMPRLLWVTAEVPDRALGGGNIRQANLLTALGERFAIDLTVAGAVRDERVRAAVRAVDEVDVEEPAHPSGRIARRVADLTTALRRQMPEVHRLGTVRAALSKAVAARADDYDLVLVHHHALAPMLTRAHRAPWLLHLFNLGEARAEQAAAVAGGRQRWLLEREASAARTLERWAVESYDGIVVVSEADKAALGAPAAIVAPNGVDLAAFEPTPIPAAPHVLISGTLGYLPNVDGAEWWCREVWPKVRATVPDATLEIVGRDPVPRVLDLDDSEAGVSVVADVPAIQPYLDHARVAAVPLRIGTGTRLKALEAMASGRPVVGTSIGLDGLGVVPGVHALVADGADALADHVVRLLTDDEEATRVARAGRALVEAGASWTAIGDALAANLVAVIAR